MSRDVVEGCGTGAHAVGISMCPLSEVTDGQVIEPSISGGASFDFLRDQYNNALNAVRLVNSA